MQEGIIVLTTTSTEENAKLIAKTLVEEKLAACVNITTIKSYYIWDNKLNEDNEFLLIIKTAKEKYESVEKRIKELHIYQLPEIITQTSYDHYHKPNNPKYLLIRNYAFTH